MSLEIGSVMMPMNVAQWIMFVIQLLLTYGPELIKLGKAVYDQIEGLRKPRGDKATAAKPLAGAKIQMIPLPSASKRNKFSMLMAPKWNAERGEMPKFGEISLFRESIWRLKNGRKAVPKDKDETMLALSAKEDFNG